MQSDERLLPVSHTAQSAHIELVIDTEGNFLRSIEVNKELTVIPATERSAGRISGVAPHPLADKVQYCAGDYASFGGLKDSYFDEYTAGLTQWVDSSYTHPKAAAVLKYIRKGCLVSDLVAQGILKVDSENKLLVAWPDDQPNVPHIFKVLTKKKENGHDVQDQGDALVRWVVEKPGEACAQTWTDSSLIDSWRQYDASCIEYKGFCYVTGTSRSLAAQHPAKIRNSGDKAKLISSNDRTGYTFKGRFTGDDASQSCEVGYEVTQKVHSALRWLIQRQRLGINGDQVYVAWSLKGAQVPHPLLNTLALFGIETEGQAEEGSGDIGQEFALRLRKALAGYAAKLESRDSIIVMGLDSATPGRMAIIYYRELQGSEFFERLNNWHSTFAWHQRIVEEDKTKKTKQQRTTLKICAPAPRDIAEAAYGRRLDDALKKACVERLLPCIVDGRHFPIDLVPRLTDRASRPVSFEEKWEWEKALSIACAAYRGFYATHPNINDHEEYSMGLDTGRTTRDYLYGRLLACAENLEAYALYLAGENRETNAAKLMHRFADRPCSTWLVIEKQLLPYRSRIQARRPGLLARLASEIDEIIAHFEADDFNSDCRLTGEFLLGYHCQRHEFRLRRQVAVEQTELVSEKGE